MATIDEKEVISHDAVTKKLKMRIRINGVDHFETRNNSASTNPTDHQGIIDDVANKRAAQVDEKLALDAVADFRAGIGDWAGMPEGDEKQRIAQVAMRLVVDLAREGKKLQASGVTRPEAAERYMSTRSLKSKIWDNLSGTHTAKAAYLAFAGPGAGTEYGELNGYMNDLGNAAPDWAAIVTFMDTCDNPIIVRTPMSV